VNNVIVLLHFNQLWATSNSWSGTARDSTCRCESYPHDSQGVSKAKLKQRLTDLTKEALPSSFLIEALSVSYCGFVLRHFASLYCAASSRFPLSLGASRRGSTLGLGQFSHVVA